MGHGVMTLQSNVDALGALKDLKLDHRNWMVAKADLMAALLAAQPGEVVCLTGPSRAGKSKLVQEVCNAMYPRLDDAFMPVLALDIHNMASNGRFTSHTFYSEALNKIGHPFYGEEGLSPEEAALALRRRENAKESLIQIALKQSILGRRVACLVFDEVQHLLYSIGGDKAASGMLDSWKCLAGETKLVIVLVGAYPILDVLNLSPHILGRTIPPVHLPRYHRNETDIRAFKAILAAYSKLLPVEGDCGLLQWSKLLYEGSLGCIGLLSKWLRTAVAQMALSHNSALTLAALNRTRTPRTQLEQMMKEIHSGELALRAWNDDLEC